MAVCIYWCWTIALLVERFVGEEVVEERQGGLGLVHWNLTVTKVEESSIHTVTTATTIIYLCDEISYSNIVWNH